MALICHWKENHSMPVTYLNPGQLVQGVNNSAAEIAACNHLGSGLLSSVNKSGKTLPSYWCIKIIYFCGILLILYCKWLLYKLTSFLVCGQFSSKTLMANKSKKPCIVYAFIVLGCYGPSRLLICDKSPWIWVSKIHWWPVITKYYVFLVQWGLLGTFGRYVSIFVFDALVVVKIW